MAAVHISILMSVLLVSFAAESLIQYQIFEELPRGTVVGNLKQDAYHGSNASRRYKFSLRQSTGFFQVDTNSGMIKTAGVIDREDICLYRETCERIFDVFVNSNSGSFSDVIKVKVVILDINDNTPTFSQDSIVFRIQEDAPRNSRYTIPAADDRDTDAFGVKGYYIDPEFPTSKFGINFRSRSDGSHTVALIMEENLDREEQEVYFFKIIVADGGNPPRNSSLNVTVQVGDVNDNSPSLESDLIVATLEENMPIGAEVVQVVASDPDSGDNGRLEFYFDDDTKRKYGGMFRIDGANGIVSVAGTIDQKMGKIMQLAVIVSDMAESPRWVHAVVKIHVQDSNNNPPVISLFFPGGETEVAKVRKPRSAQMS